MLYILLGKQYTVALTVNTNHVPKKNSQFQTMARLSVRSGLCARHRADKIIVVLFEIVSLQKQKKSYFTVL